MLLPQALPLLQPLVMLLGSHQPLILLEEDPDPFASHFPSQVGSLAKVHSANSTHPPHRAGLVNNSSLFPCRVTCATCTQEFGESRSHSIFLHRLLDWPCQMESSAVVGSGPGCSLRLEGWEEQGISSAFLQATDSGKPGPNFLSAACPCPSPLPEPS